MATKLGSRKVQIVVVCLLCAVVVYNAFHFLGRKPGRRSFTYEGAELEEGIAHMVTPAWATGDYEPAASWGRNPFTGRSVAYSGAEPEADRAVAPTLPLTAATGTGKAAATITGVVISGESRYVLAGDLLLREGDRLGTGRIKSINRDRVIVEYESGTKTIYIQ